MRNLGKVSRLSKAQLLKALGIVAALSMPSAAHAEANRVATQLLTSADVAALAVGINLLVWDPFDAHERHVAEGKTPMPPPGFYCLPTVGTFLAGLGLGFLAGTYLPATQSIQIIEVIVLVAALLGDFIIAANIRRPITPPEPPKLWPEPTEPTEPQFRTRAAFSVSLRF